MCVCATQDTHLDEGFAELGRDAPNGHVAAPPQVERHVQGGLGGRGPDGLYVLPPLDHK